jgi:PKD repeat protein
VVEITNISLFGEHGIHGLALDPNFTTNGFLYVRYVSGERRCRIGRFHVVDNVAAPASEFVVWEASQPAGNIHLGGALEFGPDGKLYTSLGDGLDQPSAQDPGSSNGKILRLNADGSVPEDNPFVDDPAADPRVWAMGLRSPFRFAFDWPTERLWIGDVGSVGPSAREEVNLCEGGVNFGWPQQEGDRCFISDCSEFRTPVFAYPRTDPVYAPDLQSASITMGPVYRGSVYPASFDGNLFFADYANRWIRRLILNADGSARRDEPFVAPPHAGSIVDLKIGPDGLLYYVVIGFVEGEVPGVYRVEFNLDSDIPPIAVSSATNVAGGLPLRVQFSSAGSYDPDDDGQWLKFCWDFGDGQMSPEPDPEHVYTQPGVFSARLTVTSGLDSDVSDPIEITATFAPVGDIISPPEGTLYRAGDVIRFSGVGSDAEDGALAADAFSWQIHLIHGNHTHPLLGPIDGATSGEFAVATEGHTPDGTHYAIVLTLTDSDGLPTTIEREVFPEATRLTFASDPPGVTMLLDHEPTATPREVQSVVGFRHAIEARESVMINGTQYVFASWSNGQPRAHEFIAPPGGADLVAQYVADSVGNDGGQPAGDAEEDGPTASIFRPACPSVGGALLAVCAIGCLAARPRRMRNA